ncbi:sulfotransferase family protein [Nocardioides daejeonensis]|uniref:sulfotransferase family protein n=1 Tax=Nocardioides daejeonensis TaxID=1046556 RepID=UPI000D74AF6E|nr:sulfotransferase [Nocardioides daejeonensis]
MADRPSGLRARTRTRTRALRDHLPPPVRRLVRSVALAWGMATARWRLRPAVIVVGAQRAGTTTLFRMLGDHPQLVRPTMVKGTGYFDDQYHHGMRWYLAHFPLRVTARLLARGHTPHTFECSGYYLFHPLAAERIARCLPHVQVVVVLRDPVDRAYSAYRHETARGFDDLEFAEAVRREPERLAGEAERLVSVPGSTSHSHRHHAYLGRSHYAEQVRRLYRTLGRDRVHLVEAERLFAEPQKEFRRLQEQLGLDPWDCGEVAVWNARPGADLDPELRSRLLAEFAEDDRVLTELLGHQPIWREDV